MNSKEPTMTTERKARELLAEDVAWLIAYTRPHPIREFIVSRLVDRGWLTDEHTKQCELTDAGRAAITRALESAGQGEAQETEQSVKADAYDMVAEALRDAGLLEPGGSVVDTVAGLVKRPEAQAGGAVAWMVGDEVFTSESEAIEAIRQWGPSGAIAVPLYTTPPAKVPAGWKLVPVEATPEIIAGAAAAIWPTASAADIDLARKAAPIVLMSYELSADYTVDELAAVLATMAPAYRAMLAAAPAPKEGV